MRGTLWLIGLVCAALVVIPTALVATARDPEDSRDMSALEPDRARVEEWTGTSTLHLRGVCQELTTLAPCLGDMSREDGSFFLPASALDGHVVVTWRAANDSLRTLHLRIAGQDIYGESPLRLDFTGLNAGKHGILVMPARRVAGAYDQQVDWTATFLVSPTLPNVETSGRSAFTTGVACALGHCDTLSKGEPMTIVAPWRARGDLHASWDPLDGEVRIQVRGTDMIVEGATPLSLNLDGLAPGEYEIDVTPLGLHTATSRVEVAWSAALVPLE